MALGISGSQSRVREGLSALTSHLWMFSLPTHVFFHVQLPVDLGRTPTGPHGNGLHHQAAATSHQLPAELCILPAWKATRNCLLQAIPDFAALHHNAPAHLSQQKSPVMFSHSSHGNYHDRCSSAAAPHPPWAVQPAGSSHHRAFHFSPTPAGPSQVPYHPPHAFCSFPHHWV